MVGSAVLPVARHKGQLYFLFGKENKLERSAPGWSDFGGGMEARETPLEAAAREFAEESSGFFRWPRGARYIVLGDPAAYNIHIIEVPYDPLLPQYFNNMHAFLWEKMGAAKLGPTRLFEKCEIRWFSAGEIRRRLGEFRPFYRDILREHVLSARGAAAIRDFIGGGGGRSTRRTRRTRKSKK